ncbi:hypothetical protein GCM10022291_24110 [Postechiella marina]|uniref:Uncharacterized protein n=1 Tax=Postechiella marina TaxID=943941 RepID=A0ABP8CC31_9FLAO
MKRVSRRISNGFGYIGFGNSQSTFNQKSNKAFSSLKDKLNAESHFHHQLHFTHDKLSKAEKDFIKNKIRKADQKKTIKAFIITVIIFISVVILSREYVYYVYEQTLND